MDFDDENNSECWFDLMEQENCSTKQDMTTNDNNKESKRILPKRVIWGTEVPNTSNSIDNAATLSNDNYVLTFGTNPLIVIKPMIKGDHQLDVISRYNQTNSNNRIFEVENLRNYFKLNEPELDDSINRFQYEYYLSLLDPTMPRLTNCSKYYRMRYAVYVTSKNDGRLTNWRQMTYNSEDDEIGCKRKLVHIGEIHLYTIVPKISSKMGYIDYENISFFLNQILLNGDEMRILHSKNNDINLVGNHFRRYLKYLNSIAITVQIADQENQNSTYLLEQLKYPKTSDHFINPDRTCELFLRNQSQMLDKYFGRQSQSDGRSSRTSSEQNITIRQFIDNLKRFQNKN